MEYFDFCERSIKFLNENNIVSMGDTSFANRISSLEIKGRVGISNSFIKRAIRKDIQFAVRFAIFVSGANKLDVEFLTNEKLEEMGYINPTCEILSITESIYLLGNKESETEIYRKNI